MQLNLDLENLKHILKLRPVTHELIANRLSIVERKNAKGSGDLKIAQNLRRNTTSSTSQRNNWSQMAGETPMPVDECHFHANSDKIYAAISNCDGNLVSFCKFITIF